MANTKPNIVNIVPKDIEAAVTNVDAIVEEFARECDPLEISRLLVLVDARTNARYCECHVTAEKILELGTIDVPLDPEEQSDYRANREIVEDHIAFERMKDDAKERRTFSNIVAEFTKTFDAAHPLKIIGGQHRFNAIKEAFEAEVNQRHGLKVYFALNVEQRLDVQLISNTNIAASSDLFDRMQETQAGPQLRNWCQATGLLEKGRDFADKRQRGSALTVRAARTFLLNYYHGKKVRALDFDKTNTTPMIAKTGVIDVDWQNLKESEPTLWKDKALKLAAEEFAALVQAQRAAFEGSGRNVDFEEKALNFAVMSAWAYSAGILHDNPQRLKRHFELKNATGKDPLNATALAKGRHKTDADNYRGLGYRTDAKERGRLVELFFLQAEKGTGITKSLIDLAIKKYHAKEAILDVVDAEQKS